MQMLQSPLTMALYLGAAALTALGAARCRYVLSFLGGMLWASGTVSALVDGVGLDGVLTVTLALLLIASVLWRRRI